MGTLDGPSLGEAIGAVASAALSADPRVASRVADVLRGHGYAPQGRSGLVTPRSLDMPTLLRGVTDVGGPLAPPGGTTFDPPAYGYLTRPQYWVGGVIDRARTVIGPYNLINTWEIPPCREYLVPIVSDTYQNLIAGGGNFAVMAGRSEVLSQVRWPAQPPPPADWPPGDDGLGHPASDGRIGEVNLSISRVVILTSVSNDLIADGVGLSRAITYMCSTALRQAVEWLLIQGIPGGSFPGVGGWRSSIEVPRATAGAIAGDDLDNLYASIADANVDNLVWHASRPALAALRKLAAGGTYPFLQFPQSWKPGEVMYPTLFGRPILSSFACSAVGTKLDICCCDWSDALLAWVRLGGRSEPGGAVEVGVFTDPDSFHRGVIGMPGGPESIEMRESEHFVFDTNRTMIQFKMRLGTGPLWPAPVTLESGVKVGPAAYLSGEDPPPLARPGGLYVLANSPEVGPPTGGAS